MAFYLINLDTYDKLVACFCLLTLNSGELMYMLTVKSTSQKKNPIQTL
jgi:hypothetical protein